MKIKSTLATFIRSSNTTKTIASRVLFVLSIVVFVMSGCNADGGPDEDESGTIGTGIILRGTVEDTLLAKGAVIETFSSDGITDKILINDDRSFNTDALKGIAPWILRVQIDSARELYGIAYSDGTRNINSFSDAGLRRSLAQRFLDPNTVLNASNRAGLLPSSLEYDESVNGIVQLVQLVLESYEVTSADLISTSYITNNTGLDVFLKRNKVVLENDLISFQVTDPSTNIRSETRSAIELSSGFVDSGIGPSQPSTVRAISDGMNNIVLVWDPSTDDINVAGYVILRDGQIIGNTPYPQLIDDDLEENRSYSYVITALDTAGNSSAPSLPVTASTAQTVPTGAPLSPAMLSLVSSSSHSIRLAWNAPANSSVVSYRLYRGVQSTTPTLLQQVSGTTTLDTAIASNLTYCYQVSAIDVIGQESERSNTLCVDTEEMSANGDSTIIPDNWTIPNTDVDCSNAITATDVPVGVTTLPAGCYSVPQTLEIRAGATLKIEEGVILKFGESAKLSVVGTLTVLGTPNNPVLFTGTENIPGSWGGIQFTGTNSANNVLRGAVVQYGGGGDVRGAVSTRFVNTQFSMEDTLIRFSAGPAFFFNTGLVRINSFDGNSIYANDTVGFVIASAVHTLAGTTSYIDNAFNKLNVLGINFSGNNIVIPDVGIPIRWSGLTIENGSLTILPGADLELAQGAIVDVEGPVIINGEPGRPVTLRGKQTLFNGSWEGLRLRGSGNKILNYVNISHAGANGDDRGAVEIDCNNDVNVNVQIDNTDISNSASWGIYFAGGQCAIDIGSTVTYSNNDVGSTTVP